MTMRPALITFACAAAVLAAGSFAAAIKLAEPEGAEAYYLWLTGCLDAIEKDLPQYTRTAEAAAKLYVTGDYEIGAYGGDPFGREICGRSGGMMQMRNFDAPFHGGAAPALPAHGIALVGLREDRFDDTVAKIVEFRKREYTVVVFGRAELITRARKMLPDGVEPDVWIDSHAAPHGGLFKDADGKWIIPTDSTALSAASWTWVGEFVAACTRLGKMPPMYQGYAIAGAYERETKYKKVKFHDACPARLEAGNLSGQWLAALRASLKQMHDADMPAVRRTAAVAIAARNARGKLWAYLQGHETIKLLGYPNDPGWFEAIHRDWNEMKKDATIGAHDFILCVGFDQVYAGKDWENFAERARAAGAKLAWSFTDYNPEQVKAVPADEPYVNQHWARGDAAAVVPNYDIRCLPTSGVISEAVLWMVHAEMFARPDGG